MILALINLVVLTIATMLCEYFWRTKKISAETARKFMHIFGGVLIAFWPLYLSWNYIQALMITITVFIVVLRVTGLVKCLFAVKRRTIGDVLYPLTVGALAFIEPPQALFILVVLQIALADGMAAVIGEKYGRSNSYNVLGYKKSVAGTLACFGASFLIVGGIYIFGHFSGTVPLAALALMPAAVTLVENVGVYGIDNTLIAVATGVLAKFFNFY